MSRVLRLDNMTEADIAIAKRIVNWLKLCKKTDAPIRSQDEIIKTIKKEADVTYSENNMSTLILYCRLVLDEWIGSCGKGMYYAETEQEKKDFIEHYESVTIPRLKTLGWAKKKLSEEQKANQEEMFTESLRADLDEVKRAGQETKHRIINEIETRFGGVRVGA
jgi:hypothetical protein